MPGALRLLDRLPAGSWAVVTSGSVRYGVNNVFTVEAHAEGTNGLANAGTGGVVLLGNEGGVASGSVARSTYHGDAGTQYNLGYTWSNRRFNFALDSTRTRGDYRDVASLYGSPPPRVSDTALASVSVGQLGNVGVNYLRQQYPGEASSRYAGAFWSPSRLVSLPLWRSKNRIPALPPCKGSSPAAAKVKPSGDQARA